MAGWKQIATLDDNGRLGNSTTGAANGLADGVVLQPGQGGTGTTGLTAGLLTMTSTGYATLQPTEGDLLSVDDSGNLTTVSQDALASTHNHDADYLTKDAATVLGSGNNVEMTGNLIVGGSIECTSINVTASTANQYKLNYNEALAASTDYGLLVDDSDGTPGDAGLIYKTDADGDADGIFTGNWLLRSSGADRNILSVLHKAEFGDLPTPASEVVGTICALDDGSMYINT